MKDLFQIGEISRIFHLPVKTLRYYSDLGILPPAYINPQTGYRYYSVDQFVYIDIIRNYRKMDISLEEIASIVGHDFRAKDIASVIDHQITVIETKIAEYETIKAAMKSISASIHQADQVKMNMPYVNMEERQFFISYPYHSHTPEEQELNFRRAALNHGEDKEQIYSIYGVGTDAEHFFESGKIVNHDIRRYLPEITNIEASNVKEMPSGKYALILFDDNVRNKEKYYRKLSQFMEKQGLKPIGDFSEEWIIPRVQGGVESTLIRLKIRVE